MLFKKKRVKSEDKNVRTMYYYGYLVDENANIYNKHGHKITPYYTKSGNYVVALRVNGVRKIKRVARVLYEAFNPDVDLTNKIVKSHCTDEWLNIHDLYLVEITPGGNPITKEYKSTHMKNKAQIIEKQKEYLKNPRKYRKELALLDWILEKKQK